MQCNRCLFFKRGKEIEREMYIERVMGGGACILWTPTHPQLTHFRTLLCVGVCVVLHTPCSSHSLKRGSTHCYEVNCLSLLCKPWLHYQIYLIFTRYPPCKRQASELQLAASNCCMAVRGCQGRNMIFLFQKNSNSPSIIAGL